MIKGAGIKDSKERNEANIMQDGSVDLQHGTGVDGNLHPCLRGHHPNKDLHVKLLYLVQFY
jgi:hypothetical protein